MKLFVIVIDRVVVRHGLAKVFGCFLVLGRGRRRHAAVWLTQLGRGGRGGGKRDKKWVSTSGYNPSTLQRKETHLVVCLVVAGAAHGNVLVSAANDLARRDGCVSKAATLAATGSAPTTPKTHLHRRFAADALAEGRLVVAVHANGMQLDHALGERHQLENVAKGLSKKGREVKARRVKARRARPSSPGPAPCPWPGCVFAPCAGRCRRGRRQ